VVKLAGNKVYQSPQPSNAPVILICNLDFSYGFFFNLHVSNFMKICPLGAELVHSDGRTDMTKLIVAVLNFVKVPKDFCINQPPAPDTHLPRPNNHGFLLLIYILYGTQTRSSLLPFPKLCLAYFLYNWGKNTGYNKIQLPKCYTVGRVAQSV
jgi:hypothetical protein